MAKVVPPAEFIGLMISSPGFGFASLTGEAVLRHPHAAQAKSRTQRSWIFCTHESQKPEFGHLGSGCHSGKWIFAVGLVQNFKGADLICFILFFSVLCRIKHPNIVSLEDLFESKSHRYLVMQL